MLPNTYKPEVRPPRFKKQEDEDFEAWIKKTFTYPKTKPNPHSLFKHQRLVRDYMQLDSPYRGIVLYHGLGVGKTRSAITIMEVLVNEKKVILLLPAYLQPNFMNEMFKYGNELYVKQRYWTYDGVAKQWIAITSTNMRPNYDQLNKKDRDEIDNQINKLIEKRIITIKYNSLRREKMQAILQHMSFDNHVIIVDEVHNFISQVVNGSLYCRSLYNHIMKAQDIKIVCLSGTPLINAPIEYAFLMNLVAGFTKIYQISLKKKAYDTAQIRSSIVQTLQNRNDVANVQLNDKKRCVELRLHPDNFVEDEHKMLIRVPNKFRASIDELVKDVPGLQTDYLKKDGIKIINKFLFPIGEEEFNRTFINWKAKSEDSVINQENQSMLASNSRGLVSYFFYYNKSDYPSQSDIKVRKVDMTKTQMRAYVEARGIELEFENMNESKMRFKARTTNKMFNTLDFNALALKKDFNYFKTLSRQKCNIAYPRQRTKTEKLDEYLNDMESNYQLFSNEDKLKEHAPKFHEIIKHIQKSNGPAIFYSQYRDESGVGCMSYILKMNGWTQITIKKSNKELHLKLSPSPKNSNLKCFIEFKTDKYSQFLIDLYNGNWENLSPSIRNDVAKYWPNYEQHHNNHGEVVKTILITQSGSEGISLKHTRQVHILEPYWNYIRLQQIVGRAVRAKSHVNLPLEERHVDVYLYTSSFSKESKNKFMNDNNGLTSDEVLFKITRRKQLILGKFLDVMKRMAFDCRVHEKVHQKKDPEFKCGV